jgi:hypothetical protein
MQLKPSMIANAQTEMKGISADNRANGTAQITTVHL